MARINLLPWREEYRLEKKKEFVTQFVGVCILAALITYVWMSGVGKAIEGQKSRNNTLNAEITILNKQVKEIQELKKDRQNLIERMRVIQDLQGTRPVIVRYFDEFSRSLPDGVFVTSLRRQDKLLFIEGVAESNNRVSDFMRQLNASEYFDAPNLRSVTSASEYGEQSNKFSMQVSLVLPGSDAEGT